MPDDTNIPNPNLPPGLSSVSDTSRPPVGAATPGQGGLASPNADPGGLASPKPSEGGPVDPSALADLAKSLNETPSSPIIPTTLPPVPAPLPEPVQPGGEEPPQKKKSSGKTSAIIGGLFLLIVLPVVGYYVSQKTDMTKYLPQAARGTKCRTNSDCACDEMCVLQVLGDTTPSEKNRCIKLPAGMPNRCGIGSVTPRGPTGASCEQRPACLDASPPCTLPPSVVQFLCTPTPTGPVGTVTPTSTLTPTTTPVSTAAPTSTATPTPTQQTVVATATPTPTQQVTVVTATPTQQIVVATATPFQEVVVVTATPAPLAAAPTPKVPVSGTPAVLGAFTVAGGILLLLLGLLL